MFSKYIFQWMKTDDMHEMWEEEIKMVRRCNLKINQKYYWHVFSIQPTPGIVILGNSKYGYLSTDFWGWLWNCCSWECSIISFCVTVKLQKLNQKNSKTGFGIFKYENNIHENFNELFYEKVLLCKKEGEWKNLFLGSIPVLSNLLGS